MDWPVKGRNVSITELDFNHLINIASYLKRNSERDTSGKINNILAEINKRLKTMDEEEKKKYMKRIFHLTTPNYDFNKEDFRLKIRNYPSRACITSIREILPRKIWEKIERRVIDEAKGECSICDNNESTSFIYVDYVWEVTRDTQTLVKVRCLCDDCYGTVRYGNNITKTKRWTVVNKLMELNGWNESKAQQYIGNSLDERRQRNIKSRKGAPHREIILNISLIEKYCTDQDIVYEEEQLEKIENLVQIQHGKGDKKWTKPIKET